MNAVIVSTIAAVLGILLVIALVALVVVSVFAIRYGRMVLAWERNINDSLDMLDEAYANMSAVIDKPLFVNTPEVREFMNELERCREAVLVISNALVLPARPMVRDGDVDVTD